MKGFQGTANEDDVARRDDVAPIVHYGEVTALIPSSGVQTWNRHGDRRICGQRSVAVGPWIARIPTNYVLNWNRSSAGECVLDPMGNCRWCGCGLSRRNWGRVQDRESLIGSMTAVTDNAGH